MSIFAITFRIERDAGYADRYDSVISAIKSETSSTYWDEPTSFFLIESSKNSEGLADSINARSTFSESRDLLLVVNLSQRGYKALGKVEDADLHRLMERR